MSARPRRIELDEIAKRFGGVQAVRGVTLGFDEASIVGLVGENGAGKSTLGKMLAGVVHPDSGRILIKGEEVRFRSPRDALRQGIAVITQELSIIPKRSAVENVFLGAEQPSLGFVSKSALAKRYAALAELTGFAIEPDTLAGELRIAEQIRIEIMRALARDARVIVMDEVTASLTFDESERLFEIVRALRERGTTVIYISHFLDEVLALVDDVHVMRDGALVKSSTASAETPQSLVNAMVGRSFDMTLPPKQLPPADAPVVFAARNITRRGIVNDVSVSVRAGEIVGIAGLIGSGRSEFVRAVFGADKRDAGIIELLGKPVKVKSPGDAVRAGIAMVPESRKDDGLMMRRSIVENVTLPHIGSFTRAGFLDKRDEGTKVAEITERLDLRASSVRAPVGALSGGNQQKVLFAKWLLRAPKVLIADEPTRGVDVAAKLQIYELIADLAQQGLGVLLISSELEEVIGLSHRVLVMRDGRIVAEFAGDQLDRQHVMQAAFGAQVEPAPELVA
ncbi:MAG: transporter related protein [Actinomycetia bacterium]|nr:transporter related protein [Actinomycetes bacterium]